jgi:hypothetical protein
MLPDEMSIGCVDRSQAPVTEATVDVCASTYKIEPLPIPRTGAILPSPQSGQLLPMTMAILALARNSPLKGLMPSILQERQHKAR